ncbi:hypothetical protein DL765_008871 [Monosporascus sp. GIB2]|nr:hypothetical protein DL765_008871 [Monosporascus sp. GIB2]
MEYYLFRTKNEVQESLYTYITRIIKRLETLPLDTEGRKRMVQILRLDSGKEFGVTKIENFCAVEGIELVISSAYNQYQNGVSERGIQFLQDECFEDAFEPDRSHKPDNSHLRILGSRCTVLIDKNYRTRSEKLAARGAKGILLGYQGTHNYKLWLVEGGRLLTTPHVTVYEDLGEPGQPPSPKNIIRDDNVVSKDDTDLDTRQVKRKRGRAKKTVPELYALEASDEAPELMRELKLALTQEGDDSDDCDPYPYPFHLHPLLDDSSDADSEDGYRLYAVVDDGPSLREAMEGPEREMWLKAILTEIKENLQRGIFYFTPDNRGHGHLVDVKWVLRKKYTFTGELKKYKARICARDFTQRKGINYNKTTASIAKVIH